MQTRAVITLPLSPARSNEFARFVTPIVGETISKGLNSNFYLCVNMLDSYNNRDKYLEEYQSRLIKNGINADSLWLDVNNLDLLLQNIYRLIKLGYIYEIETEIYRCDCGVIELEKKNLATINPDKKHFMIKDNELICCSCGSACKSYKEKVLIFDGTKAKNVNIIFFPDFLNKDAKTFEKTILSSYSIISRNRNTKIGITYNNHEYMLDIDFVWELYLNLFKEREKIITCGNKEIYQMFMCGVLEHILDSNSKSLFIGTPIINKINEFDYEPQNKDDILTRKLAVIFNITWGSKVRNYDVNMLDKLKRIPYDRKLMMYNLIINHQITEKDFYLLVKQFLTKQFNYQEIVRTLKRRN